MRLEVLQEFAEIANRLNISSTAEVVNMAQPALSKHMAELEKELGFELFVRGRKMRLTPAGKVYFSAVAKMLYTHRLALEECERLKREHVSEIRIFKPFVNDEGALALMRTAREFAVENPRTPMNFTSPRGRTPEECVVEGRVDVAVTVLGGDYDAIVKSARNKGVLIEPVLTAPLLAWAAKDHPVHTVSTLTMSTLKDYSLMMPANRCFDSMRAAVHGAFGAAGKRPPDDTDIIPVSSLQEFFLRAGAANIALVTPITATDPTVAMHDNMATRVINDSCATVTFAFVCREHPQSASVNDFVDAFRHVAESDASGTVIEGGAS